MCRYNVDTPPVAGAGGLQQAVALGGLQIGAEHAEEHQRRQKLDQEEEGEAEEAQPELGTTAGQRWHGR